MPRLLLLAVLVALLGSTALADGDEVHSPNVASVSHLPAQPARGQPVDLFVDLHENSSVAAVKGIYCRVQAYACAPALNLTSSGTSTFTARIPWERRFFSDDVTRVGYKFEIHYENATIESSPLRNFPETPEDLPAGADLYYFYALEKATPLPALPVFVGAVALAVFALRRSR